MELGIGTVQFGLDYGISNCKGRPAEAEVQRILALAAQKGIEVIDTAAAYGDAEALLGRCMPKDFSFRVVTKTAPLCEALSLGDPYRMLRQGFEKSLECLGLTSVEGLLIHHAADLFGPSGAAIWSVMEDLRREGLTRSIGLSVYTGKEIDMALDRFGFDIIQVPGNVLDQRLIKSGHLDRLRRRRVEVHLRSVFLQGLLLMEPEKAPRYFDAVRPSLVSWRRTLAERGVTPAQGALAFARSLDAVSVVIVGVESAAQLERNIADFAVAEESDLDFMAYGLDDERFVNPAKWQLVA